MQSQIFLPINLRRLCKTIVKNCASETKRHSTQASLEINIDVRITASVVQRSGSVLLPQEWNMSRLLRLISVLNMMRNLF